MENHAPRLVHTCVNVADADEAVEWYAENFGFEDAWTWRGVVEGVTMYNRYVADEHGAMLQFKEIEGRDTFERGDAWDHIGIQVADVDRTVADVDHQGIVIEPQDNPNSDSRIAFIRDLNGYLIEVFSPLEAE